MQRNQFGEWIGSSGPSNDMQWLVDYENTKQGRGYVSDVAQQSAAAQAGVIPQGGGAPQGGGLIRGRQGGMSGPVQQGQQMPKHGGGTIAAGGAAGAAAGALGANTALGAMWGAGVPSSILAPMAAMGPVGWGVGGALLAMGMLGGQKSNKEFEGEIDTGGASAWRQAMPNDMAQVSEGYIPTAQEFTTHGRWLLGKDTYAHDYGRTFGAGDSQYYQNFQSQASTALQSGNKQLYRDILASHGFDVPGGGGPAKSSGGGSKKVSPAAVSIAAAPDRTIDPGKPIEKPKNGLENTIKVDDLSGETLVRNYLGPNRNSVYIREDSESRKRRKKAYGMALRLVR